jgi:hypothetical protein
MVWLSGISVMQMFALLKYSQHKSGTDLDFQYLDVDCTQHPGFLKKKIIKHD